MLTPICELETGARNEIGYRARDQYLTGFRQGSDPRSDMHSDSSKVSASLHAFTSVDPGAHLDTEWSNRIGRGHGALHGSSWTVD